MGTVSIQTSGDDPAVLQPSLTDAIAAAQAYLLMVQAVLVQVNQSASAATDAALTAIASSSAAANSASAAQESADAAEAAAGPANGKVNFNLTSVNDANYSIVDTVYGIIYASLTATRIVTLPKASTCIPGQPYRISDGSGNCSLSVQIEIVPFSGDTISGGTTGIALGTPYQGVVIYSDGVSKWSI